MKKNLFELEEKRLKEEIQKRGAKRVLVQLPEGLRPDGPRLATIVEDAGAIAIVSGDPCYGACDLPICETQSLAVDLIVHYGHTRMMRDIETPLSVIYMEARSKVNVKAAVEKAVDRLQLWNKIGLLSTVQHIHALNKVKKILEGAGKTVYIGDAGNTKYPGQVLGCDYSNAKLIAGKVEAFLFVGGGRFHALGLSLATMKPTIVADPFEKTAYSIETDVQKILKRRWAEISRAKEAGNFGVLIGLKPGQRNLEVAVRIKEDLEKNWKKAVLLAMREITPTTLSQFPTLEAYVNTACPRVALDEPLVFTKPVLTVKEAYVMIGKMRWEDLLREGII